MTGPFEDLRVFVPPRRSGRVRIWPYLTDEESETICDAVMEEFVPEMVGSTTFEPPWRPAPWVSDTTELAAFKAMCEKWFPVIRKWLQPLCKPAVQTYPRSSRLGWPYFEVPKDKIVALQPWIAEFLAGHDFPYKDALVQINVRLQSTDPPGKDRKHVFVTREGTCFESTVTWDDRTDPKTGRTGSRTRLVFNYPVTNLLTQCVDNMYHRALMKFPMFHHNMHQRVLSRWRSVGECHAFDLKHCERLTGVAALIWARVLGGKYEEHMRQLFNCKLITPAIGQGRENFAPMVVRAINTDSQCMQLGSGLSCVSVIQKLMMFAAYAEYESSRTNADMETVLLSLASHLTPYHVLNMGDDNFVDFGLSKALAKPMLSFLQGMLPNFDLETPPAFLRFLYTDRGFVLADRSLVLNTTCNERPPGSRFRRFPHWGWLQKCLHFQQLGSPNVPRILAAFQRQFDRFGITQAFIRAEAMREAVEIEKQGLGAIKDWRFVVEKADYLLSDEEKAAMPHLYAPLPVETVSAIISTMLKGG